MSDEKPQRRLRWLVPTIFALFVVVFLVANHVDRDIYENVHVEDVYRSDWAKALRTVGYLPLWLIVAVGLILIDGDRQRGRGFRRIVRRGAFLGMSTLMAGIIGEILKMTLRRERPLYHDGMHVFRPWENDWWATGGLALPSSHTVIAFAAAVSMSLLYPRTTLIWLVAAAGCGWTRILNRDHFFSDVVLGAFVGAASAWLLWRFVFHPRDAQREMRSPGS